MASELIVEFSHPNLWVFFYCDSNIHRSNKKLLPERGTSLNYNKDCSNLYAIVISIPWIIFSVCPKCTRNEHYLYQNGIIFKCPQIFVYSLSDFGRAFHIQKEKLSGRHKKIDFDRWSQHIHPSRKSNKRLWTISGLYFSIARCEADQQMDLWNLCWLAAWKNRVKTSTTIFRS